MKRTAPNYQAWSINEKDFPHKGSIEEQVQFLTGYGILAPSTHNTQPWRFELDGDSLVIAPDWYYQLPAADPSGRNLFISLGACAYNSMVAAAHFGFKVRAELAEPTPGHGHIRLTFVRVNKPDTKLAVLFPALTRRYSEKRSIKGEEIAPAVRQDLLAASEPAAKVFLTHEPKNIQALARLCYLAAKSYATHPTFGRELSQWARGNNTTKADGMPGVASGLSNSQAVMGKTAMRVVPKVLGVMSKKYLEMVRLSSELGIITTPADTWRDWVQAGMTYERLALQACLHGVSLSPMAALIERPERKQLKKFFTGSSGRPQMAFRLIKADPEATHSPRRTMTRQALEFSLATSLRQAGVPLHLQSRQVGSYRINYVTAGNGPPLLLIHGANIGWAQWLPNLGELSKHFTVIAVDLPGCGGSTPADFRQMRFETDFVGTMKDFLLGLNLTKPLAVVGHSFGAAIALKVAQQPELRIDRLILASPMGFSRRVPGRQKLATIDIFAKLLSRTVLKPTRATMTQFLAEPLVNADVLSADLINLYSAAAAENRHNHPILFMNSLTKPFMIRPELLLVKDLPHIQQPTLLIMGDADPLVPLLSIKTGMIKIPHAKLKVFANTGHVPSLERPDEFDKAVVGFLA